MSTYVMSDIHGDYNAYIAMLDKIGFADEDMLYILGDVIDRMEGGLKILKDMMLRSNVIPILGNHEYMMSVCSRFLLREITEESVAEAESDVDLFQGLIEWMNVGGSKTISEMAKLTVEEREDILDYVSDFSLWETVRVNGNDFVLVHAGLCNFERNRSLEDYQLSEILFTSPRYNEVYFPDKYLVTGHLPTRVIWADGEQTHLTKENRDDIFIRNNHIAIDCGSSYNGQLGCIRLDDLKEFYVK